MRFEVKDGRFWLNGRKTFLNSGEIHYFRIKKELWDKHLEAAREAGLTTISTYVPWAWHEPTEGNFDFDGTTCPERDLKGWLAKCVQFGLACILKPGPYILAEFRGAGLPDWLLEKHGTSLRVRNSQGEFLGGDWVNLFHPVFMEKVTLWYDQVMPLISMHQAPDNGPVIMMQVCNEIGVFAWLAHAADYSGDVQERFVKFLKQKYNHIDLLNATWETSYNRFEDIALPPESKTPYSSEPDRARDYDWHRFWRTYYGDYLKLLAGHIRSRGVSVPLYHNLPGWIFGSGYEFPVNITMYEEMYGQRSEIIFGVDHIPEFVSYRNMHDDRIINDITLAMQGSGPLFAAEFQSGSREYHVVTSPREMELFYKASIANGLTGWNYYMFSQGKNPPRKGYSGDTFYWFTPLTAEGKKTSAFGPVKKLSRILKTCSDIILEAERKAEVCVLFYPPYYATELERPETGASQQLFRASAIRRPAFYDGLLKALQVLNVDYDMADLTQSSPGQLNQYKQVWLFCTDEMNADHQKIVVDALREGCNLVVFPNLPNRDLWQRPCTIIRDALAVEPVATERIESPLVDILGFSDIKCANPLMVYTDDLPHGVEIIARTITGKICGIAKKTGKGSLLHLGTWIGFDTEGHKPVYRAMLQRSGAKLSQAEAENQNITIRQRFTGDGRSLLFIANYYNEENWSQISYTHPQNGNRISIPFSGEAILWPPLYGLLTPVCLELTEGIKVLHTTSNLLEIEKSKNQVLITLEGDRDLEGELVLEGDSLEKVINIEMEGALLYQKNLPGHIVLNYKHLHKKEFYIRMVLK